MVIDYTDVQGAMISFGFTARQCCVQIATVWMEGMHLMFMYPNVRIQLNT